MVKNSVKSKTDKQQRILCFGDSLTWGFAPVTQTRYTYQERWVGVLDSLLRSDGYEDIEIIEDGLNDRTIARDDPGLPGKNGLEALCVRLENDEPYDVIIVFLGANNMKKYFSLTCGDIAREMTQMLNVLSRYRDKYANNVDIIVISPPLLGEHQVSSYMDEWFDFSELSLLAREVIEEFGNCVSSYGCSFVDVSCVASVSKADNIHFDVEGHKALGNAVYKKLIERMRFH
ncbi:MAG: hypothetical protein J6M18_03290 [Actinomycetaceae bacterium]|nr:hypothetical protein [Actinomycetaceae bacterium]